MKKTIIAIFLTIAVIASFSWNQQAWATWYAYDDFNGTAVDTTKWSPYILGGFSLSETGGNLVLSGTGSPGIPGNIYSTPRGMLFSTALDTSSINAAYITYSDFFSIIPADSTSSTALVLGVGQVSPDHSADDYYMIQSIKNRYGNFLWAGHVVTGSTNQGVAIPYGGGNTGAIGIFGSATGLYFQYQTLTGWLPFGPAFTVELDTPLLWTGGTVGDGITMSAKIGGVYVNSVPEPATMLLLGLGLVGLAGVRRKFKN